MKRKIVAKVETFDVAAAPWLYYFRLRARNGEIVAQSEGYVRSSDRNDTAEALAKQLGVKIEQE